LSDGKPIRKEETNKKTTTTTRKKEKSLIRVTRFNFSFVGVCVFFFPLPFVKQHSPTTVHFGVRVCMVVMIALESGVTYKTIKICVYKPYMQQDSFLLLLIFFFYLKK